MDWWLITFFLGALLSLFLPTVPTIFCVVLLIVLAGVIFFFAKTRKFTALILGCVWLQFHGALYQEVKLSHTPIKINATRQAMIIQGEIITIPQLKNKTKRFNFLISHINNQLIKQDNIIRLSWKSTDNLPFNHLSQGQKWQFKVRLKPAHGLANTAGFSYQTWLRKYHIVATGYVINTKKNKTDKAKNKNLLSENKPLKNTATLRQALYNKIASLLPSNDLSPIVLALTFGERSQLTKTHWQVLKNTATQHLIAISGLHLGLVAGGAYIFFSLLMKIIPLHFLCSTNFQQKLLRTNHQLIVILFTLAFALFYSYLAGFSVPTSRALLMLLLYWTTRVLGIKLSVTRLILLTIFCIILFSPFSLFSNSFWLSLYAVSVIFLLMWRFRANFSPNDDPSKLASVKTQPNKARSNKAQQNKDKWFNKCRQWLSSLFYLQIGLIFLMIPITVQFNHQLSLLALPANLLAVPWMSVTAIPLSLLAVIFLPVSDAIATFFIEASLLSLTILWQYLAWLSDFSLANINISYNYWLMLVCFSLLFILLIFIDLNARLLLIFCVVLGVIGFSSYQEKRTNNRAWQVSVMDVGQGLSVIIETQSFANDFLKKHKERLAGQHQSLPKQNQVLIYDTGASFPSGFSMAETVLVPYLINQGYQTIDKLIISHDDNDHAGGLSLLTEKFAVEQLIYNKNNSYFQCLAGQKMTWKHLTIEFLWPDTVKASHNDDSCVIKISDGKNSVLLTGDISKNIEQQLSRKHVNANSLKKLQADILIVPHHGSKTSSSPEFIHHVSPQYAVFSAGYLNRWKMPVASVVERYHQKEIRTFNTAENGMIQFSITPQTITVKTFRQDIWPYWFAN